MNISLLSSFFTKSTTKSLDLILGSKDLSGQGSLRSGLLLILTIGVMNFTLVQAEWVKTPNLFIISITAIFFAYRFSANNTNPYLKHLISTIFGLLLILFLISRIPSREEIPSNFLNGFTTMVVRIRLWIDAAIEGGISTDTIIFTFILVFFVWIASYCSAYWLFKYKNLWGTLLPISVLHLTNLSYLTDAFVPFLFLYLIFALPLAVSVSMQGRANYWSLTNVVYPINYEWKFVLISMAIGFVFIGTVMIAPLKVSSIELLEDSWNQARSPLERLDVHMKRLFSGIAAKKSTPYNEFGSVLAFQGALSLDEEILFLASSPEFTYWRVRTYPIYAAHGWLTGDVEIGTSIDFQTGNISEITSQLRQKDKYIINSMFATDYWPVPSHITESNDLFPVSISPKPHRIFLSQQSDNSSEMNIVFNNRLDGIQLSKTDKADVFVIFDSIAKSLGYSIETILVKKENDNSIDEIKINKYMDLFLTPTDASDEYENSDVVGLEIIPSIPFWGDSLGFQSTKNNGPSSIILTGYQSYASADQLRKSSQEYPRWITDTYIQLPSNFDKRVKSLARSITFSETNTFDKSKAIEEYLKNNFEYSLNISSPPFDSDGVGYFLYESKKGYSEYFASSMTVMLRSIGIPSRIVVGYAPRDPEYQGNRMILRDKDRHGWVEVYFPGYGWIEFEPTPGMTSYLSENVFAVNNRNDSIQKSNDFEIEDTEEDDLLNDLNSQGNDLNVLPFIDNQDRWFSILIILSAVFGVAIIALISFNNQIFSLNIGSNPKRVFSFIVLYGQMLGIRKDENLTPNEFSEIFAQKKPDLSRESKIISKIFSIHLYGNRYLSYWETISLNYSWKKVCLSLLFYSFKLPFIKFKTFFRNPL